MTAADELTARMKLAWTSAMRRLENRRTPPAVWDDKSLTGKGEEECSTESTSTTPR